MLPVDVGLSVPKLDMPTDGEVPKKYLFLIIVKDLISLFFVIQKSKTYLEYAGCLHLSLCNRALLYLLPFPPFL